MYIDHLKIKNFRNIDFLDVSFDKRLNFILGNNAQGKTSIVEAIYSVAFLKSFRSEKNLELLKYGKDELNINIDIVNSGVIDRANLYISEYKKQIRLNGKKPENYKYLNVVIFFPDEINYISSYPSFRRSLIDRSIFYVNYNYINIYKKYVRCLKQRNIFLKKKNSEIDCWKDQLINYGAEIIRERIRYIDKINKFFKNENFKKINEENYELNYSKKISSSIEEQLAEELNRKQERERQLGYTLVGPHRDDIIFLLNDRPADAYASQGQKRSMIISYKMAQIIDYKAVQGHYPVLILDDMASELDSKRKNILLENLLQNSGQVFITSTDFKQAELYRKSKVFHVIDGTVSTAD
ncbi:DNA replication and repair protein RecF [Malonomonas rubra DSM 5091]|uniref:DNA replication and repair protein RecF n=1 Tax=Malonomonas rubra DSM 5091 TaxID=1122189 RepID=A0A1M6JU24_MALRU|nr:DNA replication/repair protein RecF [Malonomonas rubra]SHJ50181.1 DNA replication and repair protein RecF [Malonomonas rubra DSM 5091]